MSLTVVRQHDYEPVPGLPERLPQGEKIVWQGRPDAHRISVDVMKSYWIAGYFGVLIAWAIAAGYSDGRTLGAILFSAGVLAILGTIMLALVELFAWASSRTTLYTVTNRRLVMRVGVGSSITLNLPFGQIASADLVVRRDGAGDIVFAAAEGVKLSWFHLWPHVRPYRYATPQPALRCIADVKSVAKLIVTELQAAQAGSAATDDAAQIAAPADVLRPSRKRSAPRSTTQTAHV